MPFDISEYKINFIYRKDAMPLKQGIFFEKLWEKRSKGKEEVLLLHQSLEILLMKNAVS